MPTPGNKKPKIVVQQIPAPSSPTSSYSWFLSSGRVMNISIVWVDPDRPPGGHQIALSLLLHNRIIMSQNNNKETSS